MARNLQVSQLITRIRDRGDFQSTARYPDAEIQRLLSAAFGKLVNLLVKTGHAIYESTQSISTTGTDTYALPNDFLGSIGVDYQWDSDHWRSLKRIMPQERNRYTFGGGSFATHYRIVGTNLVLYPKPPTGQTYRHVYIPLPLDLSAVDPAVNVDVVLPAGEDLLVLWCVRALKVKNDESPTDIDGELRDIIAELQEAADNREMTQVHRIVDVTSQPDEVLDPADWRWRIG